MFQLSDNFFEIFRTSAEAMGGYSMTLGEYYSSHALVQVPGRNAELFCIDVDHSEIRATHARLAQVRDAAEAPTVPNPNSWPT